MSHSGRHVDNQSASAGLRQANKLAGETSTYLLQHAYNPVEWYPWGPEALGQARRQDRPILLSVGYSSCHWCHVMAHESFEDESTAELMNSNFVNIKVDREERPDIDDIYMKSVQLLSGSGGWPMTVFLTPDLKPFFAGTYFPVQDRHGMPSFRRVLLGVIDAWHCRREEILQSASEISTHMSVFDQLKPPVSGLKFESLDGAIDGLALAFDRTWGGFGNAPKFPHATTLSFLMRRAAGTSLNESRKLECLDMVVTTLDRMAWGGIHDQLGGGFARYSVDRRWLVPHFEKMLYDNALVAGNYFEGYLLTGKSYWLDVGCEALEFMLRELLHPEGGFYCSLDADSEGEEGKYYVWTKEEIEAALDGVDAQFVLDVYGVSERGNFEHGKNVLNFPEGWRSCAERLNLSESEFWQRLNPLRASLLSQREKRVRPGRDDKVLTSWTALCVSAFIAGYRATGRSKYLETARGAAAFLLDKLSQDGRLLRTYGNGVARLNAYLEDYAYLIQALLDLAACDPSSRWLIEACRLNEVVLQHFADTGAGGFFNTSDDHEKLIARTRPLYDASIPSASAVVAMNLIRLARLTGRPELLDTAVSTIEIYLPYGAKAPDQFSSTLSALEAYLAEPLEIVVAFDAACKHEGEDLLSEIHRFYLPNAVCLVADLSAPDWSDFAAVCALVRDRPLKEGKATVYICRNSSCQKPIVDKAELGRILGGSSTAILQ